MSATVAVGQRCVDAAWRLRHRLGPRGRTVVRRVVDPILGRCVGSVHGVTTDAPLVALTIDDGPDPRWTEPILEVLARAEVGATFFMLVERAESYPELVRHVVDAGHEIGLHGVDHTALPLARRPVEEIVGEGRSRLEAVSGRTLRWYRPPFGAQTLGTYRATRRTGLDVVVWGPEGADWEASPPCEIAGRLAGQSGAGDIVLLHDGLCPEPPPGDPVASLDRAAVLDATIAALARAGLGCASVGALVEEGRVRRSVWFRPPPR